MSKRHFWGLFKPAWQKSFVDNPTLVQGSFRKTGIWPVNPNIVLKTISKDQRPSTPSKDDLGSIPTQPKTPMTSRSVRQLQRAYKQNPTYDKLQLIFRSQQALAAQHSIDEHVKQGLFATLKEEEKRRKRRKRLNLVGEENNRAQLFSADEVRKALEFARAKEEQEA